MGQSFFERLGKVNRRIVGAAFLFSSLTEGHDLKFDSKWVPIAYCIAALESKGVFLSPNQLCATNK
jgi:hypothetical protein